MSKYRRHDLKRILKATADKYYSAKTEHEALELQMASVYTDLVVEALTKKRIRAESYQLPTLVTVAYEGGDRDFEITKIYPSQWSPSWVVIEGYLFSKDGKRLKTIRHMNETDVQFISPKNKGKDKP